MIKRTMTKQEIDTVYLGLAAFASNVHPIMIFIVGAVWLFMRFVLSKESINGPEA